MAIKTLTREEIDSARSLSLSSQPIRKRVHLSDVKILSQHMLEVNGTPVQVSNSAMKNLFNLLGVSKKFAGTFEKLFSTENLNQLLDTMRRALAENNAAEVWFIANPNSRMVTGIQSNQGNIPVMSTGEFIGFADSLIGDSGMDVTNWSVSSNGEIVINAFNPNAVTELRSFNGGNTEVFTGGLSIKHNPIQGISVNPYLNRLFCANGLSHPTAQESYTLNTLDSTSIEKFYHSIDELRQNNYMPNDFADRVKSAQQIPASMQEMSSAWNLIQNIAKDKTDHWIPFSENQRAYRNIGFEEMSWKEMKKAKTNTSVWDLVNGVTHFATHGRDIFPEMTENDSTRLMIQAGGILSNEWHHEGWIPSPFNEMEPKGSLLN